MPNRTILAFDYGTVKIGVAVGNEQLRTATPLPLLKSRDGVPNWTDVEKILHEWQPALLVIGLPLNMDGSSSEISQRAEKFSRRLFGRFNIPVTLVDERLSSQEALEEINKKGSSKNSPPLDSVAAALILETWFAENPS